MKRVFLLMVVPALLVALGFAQTPAASGNTDQVNIKGCLGGSEGSYTVAEDSTGKIFKITTSSADLKAYSGQEVNLVAHKAGTAENSVTITGVNMISEHCNAAAAAPAASVSAPTETISTPGAAAAAPAAAARGCDCQYAARDCQHTSCACRRTCRNCTRCDCQYAARDCQHTSCGGCRTCRDCAGCDCHRTCGTCQRTRSQSATVSTT